MKCTANKPCDEFKAQGPVTNKEKPTLVLSNLRKTMQEHMHATVKCSFEILIVHEENSFIK